MREVKFRAWDTELKKMFYDVIPLPPDGTQFIRPVYDNRDLLNVVWRTEKANRHPKMWEPLWIEGYLMQYTGLKDKNSKEIYEGDVIKKTANSHYWIFIIQASPIEQFGNNLYAIEQYSNCSENEDGTEYTFERYEGNKGARSGAYGGEIIGNMHENPELIVAVEEVSNGI